MSSSCSTVKGSAKSLVEEIEDNLMSCLSWFFSSPYSRVEEEREFLRLTSGIQHPMGNIVMRSRFPQQEVGARIDDVMDFFRSCNLPMTWLVSPSCQPSDLGQHLVSHGFVLETEVMGMTIDLRRMDERLPVPKDLTIQRITSESDMERYLIPLGKGFEFPDFFTAGWGRIDASHGFEARVPRINYVAIMDGVPASCASLFKTRDSAGIYSVATVPEMRRKGAATALIVNALREARDDGYDLGLLQAKAMGAGVYRRIGFIDQPCKIGWYIWQPPSL